MPPIIYLALIMCGSVVLIAVMMTVTRLMTLRRMTAQTLGNEEIARRLDRIEQILESNTVEIERLGESNRFVAKLLAERTGTS